MKYAALIGAFFVVNRVLLSLFPSSDEVCKYATLGGALVAVCIFVTNEVKNSRTLAE